MFHKNSLCECNVKIFNDNEIIIIKNNTTFNKNLG